MPLISAKTILTSVCLFHITLGFFFITNPLTIADQALVWVMGEAMGLVCRFSPPAAVIVSLPSDSPLPQPYSRSFEAQSPPLAFLGIVLAIFGLSDLITLSLPEEICLVHHWGAQGTQKLQRLASNTPALALPKAKQGS